MFDGLQWYTVVCLPCHKDAWKAIARPYVSAVGRRGEGPRAQARKETDLLAQAILAQGPKCIDLAGEHLLQVGGNEAVLTVCAAPERGAHSLTQPTGHSCSFACLARHPRLALLLLTRLWYAQGSAYAWSAGEGSRGARSCRSVAMAPALLAGELESGEHADRLPGRGLPAHLRLAKTAGMPPASVLPVAMGSVRAPQFGLIPPSTPEQGIVPGHPRRMPPSHQRSDPYWAASALATHPHRAGGWDGQTAWTR